VIFRQQVDSGGASGTIDSGDITLPSTNKAAKVQILGTIAAASLTRADYVSMNPTRVAVDDGTDVSADEPVILKIGIKYVRSTLGHPDQTP